MLRVGVIGSAILADLKVTVHDASLGVRERSSAATFGRDMVLYRTCMACCHQTAAGCCESLYCTINVTISYYKLMLVGTHAGAAVELVRTA